MTFSDPYRRLNCLHLSSQELVVGRPISAEMNSAMARRAQSNDMAGMIGAAIANSPKVVRFEVRCSVRAPEFGGSSAAFAILASSRQNVVSNILTSIVDRPRRAFSRARILSGGECTFAKFAEVAGCLLRQSLDLLGKALEVAQFEDNRLAKHSFRVRCLLKVEAFTRHFGLEPKAHLCLFEQKKAFTLIEMITNGIVATLPSHWAFLPLAKILKNSIGTPTVCIPMIKPFLASDDYHQREPARRDDAALLLPSKSCVNVGAPVVHAAALKTPSHLRRASPKLLHRSGQPPALQVRKSAS